MAERELLLSQGFRMRPIFTLIDFEGQIVEDVSDRFVAQGSYIRRDSTAEIDGSAVFMFSDVSAFDFGRHMLAASVEVTDTLGREDARLWRMGNWVLQPPDIYLGSNELVEVNCLDAVSLVSTRLERVFSVTPGTNVSRVITSLLRRHGIAGLEGVVDEQGNALTIPFELSTYGNWNITDPVTYLQVINQLLETSTYVGMYADRHGRLASYPWTPLKQLYPRWDFDYTRRGGSHIVPPTRRMGQREQIPNIWVGIASSLDQAGEGQGQVARLTLRAGTGSPYSVEAQGGRRNPRVYNLKVGSVEELSETLLQLQEEDITRAERVEIHCGPIPSLWQADPVRVHIPPLDLLDRRGVVREWHFPFDYVSETSTYIVDLAPDGYQDTEDTL